MHEFTNTFKYIKNKYFIKKWCINDYKISKAFIFYRIQNTK